MRHRAGQQLLRQRAAESYEREAQQGAEAQGTAGGHTHSLPERRLLQLPRPHALDFKEAHVRLQAARNGAAPEPHVRPEAVEGAQVERPEQQHDNDEQVLQLRDDVSRAEAGHV